MVVDFCVTILRKSRAVSLFLEVKNNIYSKGIDELLKPFQTAFMSMVKMLIYWWNVSPMPYIPQNITCKLKLCSMNDILH